MAKCKYCGARINEDDDFCVTCGRNIDRDKHHNDLTEYAFIFCLICFLMPLFGFILYILNRDTNPKRAKICLKWSLFGSIIYFIVIGLFVLFYFYILIEILT